MSTNSIQPDHGAYGDAWPENFAIPRSLSTGGWTVQSPGFEQQTFLGASITNVSINAGFGDTSSTLQVDLVVDEFNKSDETPFGLGDDVYHNGVRDNFIPPTAGSPVFFKFGRKRSGINESFTNVLDKIMDPSGVSVNCSQDTYQYDGDQVELLNLTSVSEDQYYDLALKQLATKNPATDSCALTFGGILQSYTQNRSTNGDPLYTVQVTDPREILSNVKLLLNNYTGSVKEVDNVMNIYGFLEYEPEASFDPDEYEQDPLKRVLFEDGTTEFEGTDTLLGGAIPSGFPMTGKGFSRRGDQGIPFYRVRDSIIALLEYNGDLPEEYKAAKFFNSINFRGFKYAVDLTGLPNLPQFYYLDFDEMSLLELALEICDVSNRDLFVNLLPVLDHKYCKIIHDRNVKADPNNEEENDINFISGIIRCTAIDRSKQQDLGSIKEYIDDLQKQNIAVENRDVGYEVSNIVTDKFVAGAQETNIHFFSGREDRSPDDEIGDQYLLEKQYQQQIIPYYGNFGNNVVTIPKGHGAYQQILLDTRHLNANGVGAFYVATEMEIRCAMISFKKWKDFLMQYNDTYLESTEENDVTEGALLNSKTSDAPTELENLPALSNNYEVTVPRSLWPYMSDPNDKQFGKDNLPKSPCNPPYGYPLYYKRATKIGIPEGGLTKITYTWNSQIMPAVANLSNTDVNDANFKTTVIPLLEQVREQLYNMENEEGEMPEGLEEILEYVDRALNGELDSEVNLDFLSDMVTNMAPQMATIPRLAKKGTENAQRICNFLKNVGSECLGKKYLVRLPRRENGKYNKTVKLESIEGNMEEGIKGNFSGPFGFEPFPKGEKMAELGADVNYTAEGIKNLNHLDFDPLKIPDVYRDYTGAFASNFNPVSNLIETNYIPDNQGGFFKRDLYKDLIDESTGVDVSLMGEPPLAVTQLLAPSILSTVRTENGRISAYVRFDNSQFLSFDGISQGDLSQSSYDDDGNLVPDVTYSLDNMDESNTDFTRFYNANDDEKDEQDDEPLGRQVAFLKCSVDEQVYFAPKLIERKIDVYGEIDEGTPQHTLPRQVRDPDTDEIKYTLGFYTMLFKPVTASSSTVKINDFARFDQKDVNGKVVFKAVIENRKDVTFDSEAYALITLPGKISPTKDSRFRDGPYQILAPETIKHYLTMDIVKGIAEFEEPAIQGETPDIKSIQKDLECDTDKAEKAKELYKAVLEKMTYAFPQRVDLAMPSPVMPDLAAIPLRSTERCYGPWVSSEIDNRTDDERTQNIDALPRYKNLGGAVEFIKDENLAPWNYSGYTKLNEAGKMKSIFANSLLLISERGGFVVPAPPSGLTIGETLKAAGPLVTNISVSIGTGGIKTTTQLDLYTVSFGKLHKQKEVEISKASRERKKLSDERNALIRKGMGKSQKDMNYQNLYNDLNDQLKTMDYVVTANQNSKQKPPSKIVATVKTEKVPAFTPSTPDEAPSQQNKVDATRKGVDISMQTEDVMSEAGEKFPDFATANKQYYNSAGGDLNEMYSPASMEPKHPNMPANPDPMLKQRETLYGSEGIDSDGKYKITIYED